MELIEKQKTNRRLHIVSNYSKSAYILDINDRIDVKNPKGVLIESISIDTVLLRFYEINKIYGIISAYVWDSDLQKVERYITDLPGNEIKEMKKK